MSPAVWFAGTRNRRQYSRSWFVTSPLSEFGWSGAWWSEQVGYHQRILGSRWPGINSEGGQH